MKRRRLLGTVAAGLALGGCLEDGSENQSGGAETPGGGTPTPLGTDEGTPDGTPRSGDAAVRDVAVTPELTVLNDDAWAIDGDRDEQFVVATVEPGESVPETSAFAFETDGTTYDHSTHGVTVLAPLADHGTPYRDGKAGWIGFAVPKPLDAADGAITWPGGEVTLDEDAVARLSRPPATFEVRAFDAPDAIDAGEAASVSVTVENVGDVDGTFVGALNRQGPMIAYAPEATASLSVAAGETVTWEHTTGATEETDAEVPDMRLSLQWRDDRLSRTVSVE